MKVILKYEFKRKMKNRENDWVKKIKVKNINLRKWKNKIKLTERKIILQYWRQK